jgi:hypothetical protein
VVKLNSRANSKSNNGAVQNTGAAPIGSNNPSNHHTLQCISDINDFKHKVNMVLQNQAFSKKSANTEIPIKVIATNASARNGLQESETPNLAKQAH